MFAMLVCLIRYEYEEWGVLETGELILLTTQTGKCSLGRRLFFRGSVLCKRETNVKSEFEGHALILVGQRSHKPNVYHTRQKKSGHDKYRK